MRAALGLVVLASHAAACSDGGARAQPDAALDAAAGGAITFRLSYDSDVPDPIYVQSGTEVGGQGWLTVHPAGGGAPLDILDDCGVCNCGACDPCPVCGIAQPQVDAIARGAHLDWTWDATTFAAGTCTTGGRACEQPTPLPAAAYLARFCWSLTTDGVGPGHHVGALTCADQPFTYPLAAGAPPVEHHECACG